MAGGERAIELLESMDRTLKQIAKGFAQTTPKAVADARDLDGQYGNPDVRFKPRDWTGPDFTGRKYSQCSPEFLDMLASALDYFADKDEAEGKLTAKGKPAAPFRRSDAARARGWAARIRGGWKQPEGATAASGGHAWANAADEDDF